MSELHEKYPNNRLRRTRQSQWIRNLVSENSLSTNDLIWPIFICEGSNVKDEIESMPGVYRYSVDRLNEVVDQALLNKISLIALFPYTPKEKKDNLGSEALSIMVGGNLSSFEKSREVLQSYGKKIKFMGVSGSGQLTKIINQICIAGLVQGLAEAVHFMKKTDLAVDDVVDVISGGAAQSWQLDNRFKTMSEDKFNFGFAVDLMRKDLGIAFEQAADFDIELEVTKIVDQFYLELQQMGYNDLDTSSLIKRLTR